MNNIYITNKFYWNDKGNDFLGAVTLPKLGAFVTDEKHDLFGDAAGKIMLEIGCGKVIAVPEKTKKEIL